MILSEILAEMGRTDCTVLREKEVEYLALSASRIPQPHCIFIDSEKYAGSIAGSVRMILTTPDLAEVLSSEQYGLCLCESPRILFFELHNYLSGREGYRRPSFPTQIGKNCRISPMSSIAGENVIIGDDVVIEEFVVIRPNTVIGSHSIIRAGAKIGGHGFEFKRHDGRILSVAHAGGVRLGEYVEVQYNSCVDRAIYPWDDTVLGDYTKLDNLIHIAHADELAENILVAAGVTFGGRTTVGRDSWIGLGATVINGISVGAGARVNLGAVATRSVPDNSAVTGNFAIAHDRFIRNLKAATAEPEKTAE